MHPTPNPMNTELLKRLQDLQEGITLISGPQGELRKAADECIKLAKLSYFEGRMKGGDQPKEPVAWMKRDSTSDLLPESALDVAMEPDAASYIRKTWMPLFAHPPKDQPPKSKTAEAVDRIIAYMDANPEAVQAAWDSTADFPNVGPTIADLTDEPKDQPKALTDEWVKARAMEVFPPDEVNDGFPWYGHRRSIEDTAARTMIRHLHKHGYISPSTDTDKLIEAWTDGDVEAAYLMGAMNASGHEPTGDTLWQSVDRVKAELDRIKDNGWKIADMVRQVRKAATSKDVGE